MKGRLWGTRWGPRMTARRLGPPDSVPRVQGDHQPEAVQESHGDTLSFPGEERVGIPELRPATTSYGTNLILDTRRLDSLERLF